MSLLFKRLFEASRLPVIGMIHLKPLPGTPNGIYSVNEIVEHALKEVETYKAEGIDGVMIENMADLPYVRRKHLGPEVVATMTRVATEVRKSLPSNIPCGIQILAGGNEEALAVSLAAGLQFVRCEGYVYCHVADEGWTDSCAGTIQRYRKVISAQNILVFADIKKKHCSHAITSDVSVSEMAKAAEFFMADGVVLTGSATGMASDPNELTEVKNEVNIPVLIGSGVTLENVRSFIKADALIIGSYFKENGKWDGQLDSSRIKSLMQKVKELRKTYKG